MMKKICTVYVLIAILCFFANNNNLSAQTTANDDMASLIFNNSVKVDVLKNDVFTNYNQVSIGIVTGTAKGTLVVNADKTFTYTPKKDFYGIDNATYFITCGSDRREATIYFAVLKPMSLTNVACVNEKIYIDMHTIYGLSYSVYTVPEGGGIVNIPVTKDASAVQTWYFEAQWSDKKKIFPRVPISVLRSDNCGNVNPAGCAVDGQLLFREDFGGNDASDPTISTTALPGGFTTYDFSTTDKLKANQYALVKQVITDDSYEWQKNFSDHTYPDDKNRGYMFLVDASTDARKFYDTKITGLCDNIDRLYFSAWVANVIPVNNKTAPDDPILRFELLDDNDNIICTYVTSKIPRDAKNSVKWRNYGFVFDPKGYRSLKLKIYNNMNGTNGNDFALDDIEIRLCVPPIRIDGKLTDTVCTNSSVSFKASYDDVNGTFTASGKNLAYRWEYSADCTNWSTVGADSASASTSVRSVYTINKVEESDGGFYRLIVSNPATVNSPLCRVVSEVISLKVFKGVQASDFRAMIDPSSVPHTVYLSSFIDTANVVSVKWDSFGNALGFIDNATGALDAQKLTPRRVYTYRYTVTSNCGSSSAKAYVYTSTDKIRVKNGREIFVCKDTEMSASVNLNQVLGVESNGTWSFPDDTSGIVVSNITTSSAKFGSSKIFNAQWAYEESSQIAGEYDVAGNPEQQAFKFQYTAVNGTVFDFTVVVGKK
jgi:hypothetical protein